MIMSDFNNISSSRVFLYESNNSENDCISLNKSDLLTLKNSRQNFKIQSIDNNQVSLKENKDQIHENMNRVMQNDTSLTKLGKMEYEEQQKLERKHSKTNSYPLKFTQSGSVKNKLKKLYKNHNYNEKVRNKNPYKKIDNESNENNLNTIKKNSTVNDYNKTSENKCKYKKEYLNKEINFHPDIKIKSTKHKSSLTKIEKKDLLRESIMNIIVKIENEKDLKEKEEEKNIRFENKKIIGLNSKPNSNDTNVTKPIELNPKPNSNDTNVAKPIGLNAKPNSNDTDVAKPSFNKFYLQKKMEKKSVYCCIIF